MESRKEKWNYIIHTDNDTVIRVNALRTKHILEKITKYVDAIRNDMKELYDTDETLYKFIVTELFPNYYNYGSISFDEGRSCTLDELSCSIAKLSDFLKTHNDDFEIPKPVITLETLGFYKTQNFKFPFYEKKLEETEEKEVVEEIVYYENKLYHRIRTTLWSYRNGWKSSVSIKYKKLPIGKKLMKIIKNTFDVSD